MSVNSSFNDSILPAFLSSNSSLSVYMYCLMSKPSSFVFVTVHINIVVLVLPLCILILHYGITEWLRKCSSSSSSAAASHSDIFTYHMVTMELISMFGYILNIIGICNNNLIIIWTGNFFTCFTWFGQIFFHILTCVERYLAVVHPILYLSLKNNRGTRIRNVTIGCVWLLSILGMSLMMTTSFFFILDLSLLTFASTIISFCSISVLHVLIRPHPGEQGDGREKVDQLKKRAFYTIVVILGVLGVRIVFNVLWEVIFITGNKSDCVIMAISVWFNVPSSLVLPLLFLHRAGKLENCRSSIKPGKTKHLQSERISHTRP